MIGKYFVLLLAIGAAAALKPVSVTVYYETLCDDSMKFFTKQLIPTWNDLKAYISPLNLVPYGKTTSTPQTITQNATFNCHHGPNECVGNKFQACLLDPTYRVSIDDQFKIIDCLMSEAKKDVPYETTAAECKTKRNLANLDVTLITSCAKSIQGDSLLSKYGRETDLFQKPLTSVPTIVFNDKHNADDTTESVKSFRAALCKYITDEPKPTACKVSGAPITTVGVITLWTAGLLVRLVL